MQTLVPYEVVQAWLFYASTLWWVRSLALLAGFWIVMQILPDSVAGGYLFGRNVAWVTGLLAAGFVFLFFVVPFVSLQLLLGMLAVAGFVVFAIAAKNSW